MLTLQNPKASACFLGGETLEQALERTTHLCIAAHQDDVEIMAASQIVECYRQADRHFSAIVITDGAGSPRAGQYDGYTDAAMADIRKQEQETAARVGQYSACVQLAYPSKAVKQRTKALIIELTELLTRARPQYLFTHNLADKHDTHVAVAMCVIEAVRRLPTELRPEKVYGMEVWRGLDWLPDVEKSVFDTTGHPNLQSALLGVFDSQIAGGKRYDDAAMGRRVANATFFASHNTDAYQACSYGLDLTELVYGEASPSVLMERILNAFTQEVLGRIKAFE